MSERGPFIGDVRRLDGKTPWWEAGKPAKEYEVFDGERWRNLGEVMHEKIVIGPIDTAECPA